MQWRTDYLELPELPPKDRYECLLIQLHQEMKEGRGDDEVADNIRNEMEEPWYKLTEEEGPFFNDLSGDLYIIEEKHTPIPMEESETQESVQADLVKALVHRQHKEALVFLRKLEKLDLVHLYIMGDCWEALGFPRGANCFHYYVYERMFKTGEPAG